MFGSVLHICRYTPADSQEDKFAWSLQTLQKGGLGAKPPT